MVIYILKYRHLSLSLSSHEHNLRRNKNVCYLYLSHCTAYTQVDPNGMTNFPTTYVIWISFHTKQNQIYRWGNLEMYGHIFPYFLMTCVLLYVIRVLVETLEEKYVYKLKGACNIAFHLSCDLFRNNDGTLYLAPMKYTEKMIYGYQICFNKPNIIQQKSPFDKGGHLELVKIESLIKN